MEAAARALGIGRARVLPEYAVRRLRPPLFVFFKTVFRSVGGDHSVFPGPWKLQSQTQLGATGASSDGRPKATEALSAQCPAAGLS
jgi:hypothetical protein